jgi:hypothetical protein
MRNNNSLATNHTMTQDDQTVAKINDKVGGGASGVEGSNRVKLLKGEIEAKGPQEASADRACQ